MDFSKIISITGKPGLYELVSQSRSGIIVQSLLDGKKTAVSSAHRVSTLADITIYTDTGDEPLEQVFQKFYETLDGKKADIDTKDAEALQEFLFTALPEYDEERVYTSDIRKMVKWYNLLVEADPKAFEKSEEDATEDADAPADNGSEGEDADGDATDEAKN